MTFLVVLFVAFIAFLGAAFGSFLNVVIWRVPEKMSLSTPPSHCPKCGHKIRWFDNVPIFSWLILRGKCRDCKAPISVRYPLVEFASFAFALALALTFLVARGSGLKSQAYYSTEYGDFMSAFGDAIERDFPGGGDKSVEQTTERALAEYDDSTANWAIDRFFHFLFGAVFLTTSIVFLFDSILMIALTAYDCGSAPRSLVVAGVILLVVALAIFLFVGEPDDYFRRALSYLWGVVAGALLPALLARPLKLGTPFESGVVGALFGAASGYVAACFSPIIILVAWLISRKSSHPWLGLTYVSATAIVAIVETAIAF